MTTYKITALVFTFASYGAVSYANTTCDVLIAEKSETRNSIIEQTQTQMQKLSLANGCANNFDLVKEADQEIVAAQAEIDRLSAQMKAQETKLRELLVEINDKVKKPETELVEPDLNALLAERLAYREQVKTWPLRDSAEVIALFQDLKSVEDEIEALRGQMMVMSEWSERAELDKLLLQERELTQKLAELQSRLTGLKRDRENPDYQAAEQLQQDGPDRVSALKDTVEGLLEQIATIDQQVTDQDANLQAANAQLAQLEQAYASAVAELDKLKADQSNSTQGLAAVQIEKNRLAPILQDLQAQETVLKASLDRMSPQAQATQAIVEQLQVGINEKSQQISGLDAKIVQDQKQVETLQVRIDAANQSITDIRAKMANEYKPLLEYQNINNQVFALELTIEGLDKEIDNLDVRSTGAEGKLNRFIRACKREPACKAALSL